MMRELKSFIDWLFGCEKSKLDEINLDRPLKLKYLREDCWGLHYQVYPYNIIRRDSYWLSDDDLTPEIIKNSVDWYDIMFYINDKNEKYDSIGVYALSDGTITINHTYTGGLKLLEDELNDHYFESVKEKREMDTKYDKIKNSL